MRLLYPDALFLIPVCATHLKIGHPWINLRVPDVPMSCRDITLGQGTRTVAPAMATR